MIEELLKELRKVDEDLSLSINLSNDGIYTFSIDSMEVGNYFYSYSSTSILDCIDNIRKFIEALKNNDKFDELFDEILNQPLEV